MFRYESSCAAVLWETETRSVEYFSKWVMIAVDFFFFFFFFWRSIMFFGAVSITSEELFGSVTFDTSKQSASTHDKTIRVEK